MPSKALTGLRKPLTVLYRLASNGTSSKGRGSVTATSGNTTNHGGSVAELATDELVEGAYRQTLWDRILAVLNQLVATMKHPQHAFTGSTDYCDTSRSVTQDDRRCKERRADPLSDRHEASFELSKRQYEHLDACMTKPSQPTPEMLSVAEEMLAFSKKFR